MTPGRGAVLRPAWQRYGGAVALTLLVVLGRRTLDPWWGQQHNRHLVFLPTVMLAAWFGGFRPGVLSAVISTVALHVLWSGTSRGILHPASADVILFLLVSLAVCGLIGSLENARARADAATGARERVLEIVAHDLRNPLTVIRTTSNGIGRGAPELGPRLQRIDRAVARMDDLIRDLVDTTRIEHGTLVVSLHTEPVAPIIQDMAELYAPMAQEKGITLEVKAPPAETTVRCDRGRVAQVLSNLVGNALKFTPAGGRVMLTSTEEASGDQKPAVRFEVTDTGRGISPENLPHVFEAYWKGEEGGTGLGLFIAQTVVQAHGGRLGVESTPGVGTTFHFTLPRPPAPAAPDATA